MSDLSRVIAKRLGLKLVEIVTRDDVIPFYRGDLRKSISSQLIHSQNESRVIVGSNLAYARAVHDGRPAMIIKPKKAKFLAWWTDPEKRRKNTPFPKDKAFSRAIKNGQIRIARQVHQPARKGNPFLIRAFEILQRESLDKIVGAELEYLIKSELYSTPSQI